MRALEVEDLGRFSYFVKTAKAKPVINEVFAMAANAAAERRRNLFALKKAAADGDAWAAEEFERFNADQNWIVSVGLRGALMLTDCAAESGAMDSMYKFLAPIWEVTPADIKTMKLAEFSENLMAMIKGNDVASFFGAARTTGIL